MAKSDSGPAGRSRLRTMLRPDALIASAVAAAFLVLARDLAFGEFTAPGPGLWPTVVAVAMLVLALVLFVTDRETDGRESFTVSAWRVLAAVGSVVVFTLAFSFVGFILPGFLMFLGWLRWFGGRSWLAAALISFVSTAAVYLTIGVWLETPFPNDIVASLWGM